MNDHAPPSILIWVETTPDGSVALVATDTGTPWATVLAESTGAVTTGAVTSAAAAGIGRSASNTKAAAAEASGRNRRRTTCMDTLSPPAAVARHHAPATP